VGDGRPPFIRFRRRWRLQVPELDDGLATFFAWPVQDITARSPPTMSETGPAPEGAEQAATDDASTLVSNSPAVSSSAAAVDGRNIDLLDSGPRAWRAYLRALGPGLVTGASDDDPSGIATYAQTGAQFAFDVCALDVR
jgi:hypothetical protein